MSLFGKPMRSKKFGYVCPSVSTDSWGGEFQGNPTGGRRMPVQAEGDGIGRGVPKQMNAISSYP